MIALRTLARLTLPLALTIFATYSHAQTTTESLATCLADNTSGRDRKDLARWIFFAMASHPEIIKYSSPEIAATAEETDKVLAQLFTRILSDSCLKQTKIAYRDGGAKAIEVAFQTFGQLAMQELMSNSDVNTTMGRFERHVDQRKLAKVFGAN